nr:MAG TPA: hypothetical protein [Caudoviricetes sp.]
MVKRVAYKVAYKWRISLFLYAISQQKWLTGLWNFSHKPLYNPPVKN